MPAEEFDFEALLGPAPAARPDAETASTEALADILGITGRMVTELGRKGIIPSAARNAWPVRDSVRAYCAHLREQAAGRSNSSSLTQERIRVAREQGDALAMKNATARGEYVSAKEVEFAWAAILREVRAALLALPGRIQLRLSQLTADDVAEIDREIRDALAEASR